MLKKLLLITLLLFVFNVQNARAEDQEINNEADNSGDAMMLGKTVCKNKDKLLVAYNELSDAIEQQDEKLIEQISQLIASLGEKNPACASLGEIEPASGGGNVIRDFFRDPPLENPNKISPN